MKHYRIKIDTTFTKDWYVDAESKEHAEIVALKKAGNNHHGEVIMRNEIIECNETDKDGCDI